MNSEIKKMEIYCQIFMKEAVKSVFTTLTHSHFKSYKKKSGIWILENIFKVETKFRPNSIGGWIELSKNFPKMKSI